MLGDLGNKRAVRILLECILVGSFNPFRLSDCKINIFTGDMWFTRKLWKAEIHKGYKMSFGCGMEQIQHQWTALIPMVSTEATVARMVSYLLYIFRM